MKLSEFKSRLFGRPFPGPAAVKQFGAVLEGKAPASSMRPKRRTSVGPGRTVKVLKESCSCGGDADGDGDPVILGVKVLGADSLNRRRYTAEAMRQATGLYENCRVNFDHPTGNPNASRLVAERFGRLVNVRCENGELRADLRYNPKHPLAASVKWFAENDPDCLGLSHNAVGEGKTVDGVFTVEKIVAVRSVDLVADPATTGGLFR